MDGSTMHSGFKELDHFHWNTFQIIDIGTNIWQTWNVQDRVQEDSFTVRLLVQVWVSSFVCTFKFWWVLSRSQSFHFGFFGKSICQHRECFHFVAHLWYFPVYFLRNLFWPLGTVSIWQNWMRSSWVGYWRRGREYGGENRDVQLFKNLLCRLGEGGEGGTEVPLGVVGGRRLDAQNGDEIRWLPLVNWWIIGIAHKIMICRCIADHDWALSMLRTWDTKL